MVPNEEIPQSNFFKLYRQSTIEDQELKYITMDHINLFINQFLKNYPVDLKEMSLNKFLHFLNLAIYLLENPLWLTLNPQEQSNMLKEIASDLANNFNNPEYTAFNLSEKIKSEIKSIAEKQRSSTRENNELKELNNETFLTLYEALKKEVENYLKPSQCDLCLRKGDFLTEAEKLELTEGNKIFVLKNGEKYKIYFREKNTSLGNSFKVETLDENSPLFTILKKDDFNNQTRTVNTSELIEQIYTFVTSNRGEIEKAPRVYHREIQKIYDKMQETDVKKSLNDCKDELYNLWFKLQEVNPNLYFENSEFSNLVKNIAAAIVIAPNDYKIIDTGFTKILMPTVELPDNIDPFYTYLDMKRLILLKHMRNKRELTENEKEGKSDHYLGEIFFNVQPCDELLVRAMEYGGIYGTEGQFTLNLKSVFTQLHKSFGVDSKFISYFEQEMKALELKRNEKIILTARVVELLSDFVANADFTSIETEFKGNENWANTDAFNKFKQKLKELEKLYPEDYKALFNCPIPHYEKESLISPFYEYYNQADVGSQCIGQMKFSILRFIYENFEGYDNIKNQIELMKKQDKQNIMKDWKRDKYKGKVTIVKEIANVEPKNQNLSQTTIRPLDQPIKNKYESDLKDIIKLLNNQLNSCYDKNGPNIEALILLANMLYNIYSGAPNTAEQLSKNWGIFSGKKKT